MVGVRAPADETRRDPSYPVGVYRRLVTQTRGYQDDKAAYLTRLRRIEGQVRGLQRMVDQDVYCIDILTQVSAVTRALQTVAVGLVEDHLAHCVREAVTDGGAGADEKVAEASAAIARLLRT